MRFLLSWQHVGPGQRLLGSGGVLDVIEQLQGYEAGVETWESVDPAGPGGRLQRSSPRRVVCPGEVSFGRLTLRIADRPGTPARALRRDAFAGDADQPVSTRGPRVVALASRDGANPDAPPPGAAAEVVEALQRQGALFVTDLCQITGRLPGEVAEALWDGMARVF